MKRIYFLALILAMTHGVVHGQSFLKGRLRDTAFDKDCAMAVVALLAGDSSLVTFTRSHKDGSFYIRGIAPGEYILMLTHPAYSEISRTIRIDASHGLDLGIVAIPPRVDSLEPVIVMPGLLSPRLKGDTVEYNTAHAKLRANATIEELLHQLPGLEVDADGTIMLNGQKIERLLVDGKDFFIGGPTLVTRNFNGDMIAKVQVLDKKSQQAEFTGVDDGQRTKTLNLVLKQDSKRGELVKMEGAGDPQGYYRAGGLLGVFKGDMQLAAVGVAQNTGSGSFSSDVGGLNGQFVFGVGNADALGASAGEGIPKTAGGDFHYANDWKNREERLAGDYKYASLSTRPFSSLVTRQTLPDSIYVQQQQAGSENSRDEHRVNLSYLFALDSLSACNLYLGGSSMQGDNIYSSSGSSSFNDVLVNSSERSILSSVYNQGLNGSLMWRRQAKRHKDQVVSATLSVNHQSNSTKGFLYSLNEFYQPNGQPLRTDTTDQRKDISAGNTTLDGSINFTDPIRKGMVLAMSYGINYHSSQTRQATYDRGDGKYANYIDSLSNHYQNDVITQRATVNWQTHLGIGDYVIGGDVLHYASTQSDLLKGGDLRIQYLNFAPRLKAHFVIRQKRSFGIDYNGSTQQPSIAELQPVQNNNDPLHITIGNPHLRGSYSHHIHAGFANFDAHNLYMAVDATINTNDISTKTITDSLGRQVSQAVNVDGARSMKLDLSYKIRVKPINLQIRFGSNFSYTRAVNYVDQYLSKNDGYMAGGNIYLTKYAPGRFSLDVRSGFTYTYTVSSINAHHALHYWNQFTRGQMSLFLTRTLELGTSVLYTWRQRLDNFDTKNSSLLWNMQLGKDFFKNQLNIRWEINDILGQNAGISRSSTANQTSESSMNVLGRYWMLSATWRFVHHRQMD